MSNQTIATNKIFANESPKVFLAGSAPIFRANFIGTAVISTATYTLYRNKTAIASAVSCTISGRYVTTPAVSLSLAGEYQLEFAIADGNETRVKSVRIYVVKNGVY